MRTLLALVVALALVAALPAASVAGTDSGATAAAKKKKKAKPCARLHGKKRKACLKKQKAKAKAKAKQKQQQGDTPVPTPTPTPTPDPTPTPTPAPGGPQLTRDDAGARAQIAFTKLTLAQETSTGLNQYCVSFGDSQYRATYDYSQGLTGGQTAEAGRWQVNEGYAVANAPFQWAVKVQLETSKGGEIIEIDVAGNRAEIVTGDGSVFQRGVYAREANASSYC